MTDARGSGRSGAYFSSRGTEVPWTRTRRASFPRFCSARPQRRRDGRPRTFARIHRKKNTRRARYFMAAPDLSAMPRPGSSSQCKGALLKRRRLVGEGRAGRGHARVHSPLAAARSGRAGVDADDVRRPGQRFAVSKPSPQPRSRMRSPRLGDATDLHHTVRPIFGRRSALCFA